MFDLNDAFAVSHVNEKGDLIPVVTMAGEYLFSIPRPKDRYDAEKLIRKRIKCVDQWMDMRDQNRDYPQRSRNVIDVVLNSDSVTLITKDYEDFLKQFVKITDPFSVIKYNEQFRRYNAYTDIYPLSSLTNILLEGHGGPKCRNILRSIYGIITPYPSSFNSLEAFKSRFSTHIPIYDWLTKINKPGDEVLFVVAGGSLLNGINCDEKVDPPNDVDIFIVGLTKKSTQYYLEEISKKIHDLSELYYNYISNNDYMMRNERYGASVRFINGLACISPNWDYREEFIPVQIILKVYPSISALLHSFDMASSAIACDGSEVYLTSMAIYSIINGVNIVNPKYASATYVERLVKYSMRGFGIWLVGYSSSIISKNKVITLGNIDIELNKNNMIKKPDRYIGKDSSDYFAHSRYPEFLYGYGVKKHITPVATDVYSLPYQINSDNMYALPRHQSFTRIFVCPSFEQIYETLIGFPVHEIFDFKTAVKSCLGSMSGYGTNVAGIATRNFDLTTEEKVRITDILSEKNGMTPEFVNMLQEPIVRLKKKYDKIKDNIVNYMREIEDHEKVATELFSSTINRTPQTYDEFYGISSEKAKMFNSVNRLINFVNTI